MKISELKDKKILILGFGLEGQATLRFLHHVFPGKQIGVADQKDSPNYLDAQKDYDIVIKTPGIPRRLVTIPYTTATNIFFENTKGKIIGVTGSKGKSTTTALLYDILKAAGKNVRLAGNIGKPMLDYLLEPEGEKRLYVTELSSYQLEDLDCSPSISLFLNFFPEHLDYHGGLEEYFRAKSNIVAHSKMRDCFVYNPKYPRLFELAHSVKAKPVTFVEQLPFSEDIIPLLGKHNVDNVRGVYTVARLLKIKDKVIEDAIRNFKALPHRLQMVGTFKGITFFDDAISTTPESTIAALNALPQVGTIFLGGKDRGYDFAELAKVLVEKQIKHAVLFPESGLQILNAIRATEGGKDIEVHQTGSMEDAVHYAYEHTPQGTLCLLSTASPSYSIWKNFEEKGDQFQEWVKKLG